MLSVVREGMRLRENELGQSYTKSSSGLTQRVSPIDCSGLRLKEMPGAINVVKRPVRVRVSFARSSGVALTLEGPVRYRRGDAIVRGDHNDEWPVRRVRFDAAYVAVGAHEPGKTGWYTKLPSSAWALRMAAPFVVKVGHAEDVLNGHEGDWLLQYASGDYGVVNDHVFNATYERCVGAD